MLNLIVPYALLTVPFVVIILLYFRKWKISAVLLLLCFIANYYSHTLPLFNYEHIEEQTGGTISILSLNIEGYDSKSVENRLDSLASFIRSHCYTDLVLLQECGHDTIMQYLHSRLANEYRYIVKIPKFNIPSQSGNEIVLLSKYPVNKATELPRPEGGENSTINRYEIELTCRDRIQIYGCHLSSNNYSTNGGYVEADDINSLQSIFSYFCNYERQAKQRVVEGMTVLNNKKYIQYIPSLILGDMNDVGNSQLTKLLYNNGYKDAWWERGVGYGATIYHPLPFRIDKIFYNQLLEILEVRNIVTNNISDHDAIFAKFRIN